jgi:hypothetical protein
VHFIRRGHKDWAEPSKIRANLAAQIEVMFPAQRDPDADPAYRLEQLVGRVSPVLVERNGRLVLLVDGLDEAMMLGKDNPIPDIFPLEVPARVFVVTASRPQYPHLGWFDRRNGPSSRLDLDAHAESNEKAVREYWGVLGKAMDPPLSDALMRAAVEGAQGNLLHAVKLHQLEHRGRGIRTCAASSWGGRRPGSVSTSAPRPTRRGISNASRACQAKSALAVYRVHRAHDPFVSRRGVGHRWPSVGPPSGRHHGSRDRMAPRSRYSPRRTIRDAHPGPRHTARRTGALILVLPFHTVAFPTHHGGR